MDRHAVSFQARHSLQGPARLRDGGPETFQGKSGESTQAGRMLRLKRQRTRSDCWNCVRVLLVALFLGGSGSVIWLSLAWGAPGTPLVRL